ncbi:MAG: peptidase T [Parasporobacterium sp.]|nr:peptidase T [Parasporobacterium sp.]
MRAYQRFIDYVQVHTTSDPTSGTHPSFGGEWNLARLLESQLTELGVQNVQVDEHCYVYGILPATEGLEDHTSLGFLAHMDTSPDAEGRGVKPQLHKDYDGSDIVLGDSGKVLTQARFPWLKSFIGETVITTDGTTLLGADDKAGCAEIMTGIERIQEEKLPHGPLYFCFTPDEEIGEGADYIDYGIFCPQFAYTLDGGPVYDIEYENFNAASCLVTVTGVNIHPGAAKDLMVNAQNVAMEFHGMLPEMERPEHTAEREGFFHLHDMKGNVHTAVLAYIIRDHDREIFESRKNKMKELEKLLNDKYGAGTVEVQMMDTYYNMYEKIMPHMHLVENAKKAIEAVGLTPKSVPVRGGTDGARISFEGIPCPNLGTGGYNCHGEMECITCESMDKAVEIMLNIIKAYA